MNPYKKLNKAYRAMDAYPTYIADSVTRQELAKRVKAAYEAVGEVVKREQTFRLNAFFKRRRLCWPAGIAGQSDTALVSHLGWAGRVIDTANFLLERPDPLVKGHPERAYESLVYAKDYLRQNIDKFQKPAKDSVFDRATVNLRSKANEFARKIKELKKARIKPFRPPPEPAPFETWAEKLGKDMYNVFEESRAIVEDVEKKRLSDAFEKGSKVGPVPLMPDHQGFNGEKTPATDPIYPTISNVIQAGAPSPFAERVEVETVPAKCENELCFKGEVRGARWGSEDYPCPKCNSEEEPAANAREAAAILRAEERVNFFDRPLLRCGRCEELYLQTRFPDPGKCERCVGEQ